MPLDPPCGQCISSSSSNNFDLVQSRDKIALLRNCNSHIRYDGLDFTTSFHPVQTFLRDGPREEVEHLHLCIHPSPLTHLKESHLECVVPFPVVVPVGNVALDSLAIQVDHLSTSDDLAKSICASRRGEAKRHSCGFGEFSASEGCLRTRQSLEPCCRQLVPLEPRPNWSV